MLREKEFFRRSAASLLAIVLLLSILPVSVFAQKDVYYPGKTGVWETRKPEEVGMNAKLLQEAVDFSLANEYRGSKDLAEAVTRSFANEPYGTILGPTKMRGGVAGMIIKDGYIVAEWGDTRRVDMTFSATKSYLSTTTGLAFDMGLIDDMHDPVKKYVQDGKFDSEHNAKITWHHLMNQSSDWSGTLWDKPDWADRPPRGIEWSKLHRRELKEPGTSYKYNDVRVNLAAYATLMILRKPLPMVLKEKVMDPIGASQTWRWHGYKNSWVNVDGIKMQSVSGGGHWGGGMFISARDHARFGYLFLRRGNWKGKQRISEKWIDMMTVPSEANDVYGYMWWLNTEKKRLPAAPESSYYAAGFGGNYVWIDNENDLVVVVRWNGSTRTLNGIIEKVLASIEAGGK